MSATAPFTPIGRDHVLSTAELDHAGSPFVAAPFPNIVGADLLAGAGATANTGAWTANLGRGRLVRCPVAGYLRFLTAFVTATDAAANLEFSVYDTGETTSGTYKKLWASGNNSIAAANAWQSPVDPGAAVPVVAGQTLMLVVASGSSTLTIARAPALLNTAFATLPASLGAKTSGGNILKFAVQVTASFPAADVLEAAMLSSTTLPLILAGIFPNPS